jgi:hypothetical protein
VVQLPLKARESTGLVVLGRIALVLGGVACALLVAEVGLMQLEPPDDNFEFLNGGQPADAGFLFDPDLFWKLDPASSEYRINAKNLRGYWPERGKLAEEIRIACVGDSCSFGTGVLYEETYGMQLEHELAMARPDLVVSSILAATPGYSSYQSKLLFERTIRNFEPDWTIIYCGAWNDYVPAIGLSDRERGDSRDSLRLMMWWRKTFDQPRASRADYLEGMKSGEYLDGERVPLDEFASNLRSLIDTANRSGRVVLIVPPAPNATRAKFERGAAYRAVIRKLGEEAEVQCLDAEKLFDEAVGKLGKGWKSSLHTGVPIYFSDWIHPSAAGHALLAQELLSLITPGLPSLNADEATFVDLGLSAVGAQSALGPEAFEIVIKDASRVESVWIGNRWIYNFEARGEDQLVIHRDELLAPGLHRIRLGTPQGSMLSLGSVVVEPHPFSVSIDVEDGRVLLRASVRGPSEWSAALWISPGLRKQPAQTRFGPFYLLSNPDGRPANRPDLPFQFDRLPFARAGLLSEEGVWNLEFALDVDAGSVERIYVQAGILDANSQRLGALTTVRELSVPASSD